MKNKIIAGLLILCSLNAYAQKKDYLYTLSTPKGKLVFVLYDETPLHKANFNKLVKEKFYDGLLFHRVIQNFMIQGGDPNSKTATKGERLGSGGGDMERIPFEYDARRFHKKGVIAAARDNNPEKKSSACQFYIVHGKKFTESQLAEFEKRNNFNYTAEQKKVYETLGGTPHLDKNYTVFGEVLEGLDVLDSIAAVKVDDANRPEEDQRMAITMKKLRKKKIIKKYGYTYL